MAQQNLKEAQCKPKTVMCSRGKFVEHGNKVLFLWPKCKAIYIKMVRTISGTKNYGADKRNPGDGRSSTQS